MEDNLKKVTKLITVTTLLLPCAVATNHIVFSQTMNYENVAKAASEISSDIKNYNGIIYGNHIINGADNEGATIVMGDIIYNEGYTYGGAASGPGVIIGQP